MSDGLGTFEALLGILGDSKATAAKLAQLKQATEEARGDRNRSLASRESSPMRLSISQVEAVHTRRNKVARVLAAIFITSTIQFVNISLDVHFQ
jgi:hypothetical protein